MTPPERSPPGYVSCFFPGRCRVGAVTLTPGTYTLQVRSRPEWAAKIVVTGEKQQ